MTATNQCIVLNPSSSNAEHEVSHSDRWKAQSSLTRTFPLPLHMLQTNYKPTLYCLLNTQLQKVLIALDHLGFKSYYIQVQKDATKVFQVASGDTYDELWITSHGNDCSIYRPQKLFHDYLDMSLCRPLRKKNESVSTRYTNRRANIWVKTTSLVKEIKQYFCWSKAEN